MGGELYNFFLVLMLVLALLCYCHRISKSINKGASRLFTILPIVCIFLVLPLHIVAFNLRALASFFVSWLANFKLLLFAFDHGPLSQYPALSWIHFIAVACLPIKIQHNPSSISSPDHLELVNAHDHNDLEKLVAVENSTHNPSQEILQKGLKSPLNYTLKLLLVVALGYLYTKEEYIHPKIILLLYAAHVYISLELILAMVGALARACLGVEIEPQFDEPYLASSLQDFWGRRWNLMVTSIIHTAIFSPIRSVSSRWIAKKWTPLPAVIASFFVSGIVHELIFYHIGNQCPTWGVTGFFLLHGFCLAVEIGIKREINCAWGLPRVVAAPLVIGFVLVTAMWLFMPTLIRCKIDVEAKTGAIAFINFVKGTYNHLY